MSNLEETVVVPTRAKNRLGHFVSGADKSNAFM